MRLAVATAIALLFAYGAAGAQEQHARSLLLTPSIGLAAPVGAFSHQNPVGQVLGLGFDVPVLRRNQLGVHYQLQRYGLDAGVTEWIGGVSVHDRMFLGEGGFFFEAGLGLYFDERSSEQDVAPLVHIAAGGVAATAPALESPTHGIDASIGWRFPGRSVALMAGYQLLFARRMGYREELDRIQCLVFGLQAGLRVP